MMVDEIKDTAGAVVGHLLKAAGDDPKLKQAGQHLANVALTVSKAIDNVLVPLAAINFGFDKARTYFETRFREDFAEHVDAIPPEHVVMPKVSVAGPALQGLAFTHEEPDLKAMYLNLLSAAIDARRGEIAHPAFVEIIKQLTSQEARLLPAILNDENPWPIAEIRIAQKDMPGWVVFQSHVLDLVDEQAVEPIGGDHVATMVTNWIRLGLIQVDYSKQITTDGAYSWVEQRPEYKAFENVPPGFIVKLGLGCIERTSFGKQFARAAGLSEQIAR